MTSNAICQVTSVNVVSQKQNYHSTKRQGEPSDVAQLSLWAGHAALSVK